MSSPGSSHALFIRSSPGPYTERSNASRTSDFPRRHWILDRDAPACYGCSEPFTLSRRRHHCRQCGHIFCGECAGVRIRLPESYGYGDLRVRVCDQCLAIQQSGEIAAELSDRLNIRDEILRSLKLALREKTAIVEDCKKFLLFIETALTSLGSAKLQGSRSTGGKVSSSSSSATTATSSHHDYLVRGRSHGCEHPPPYSDEDECREICCSFYDRAGSPVVDATSGWEDDTLHHTALIKRCTELLDGLLQHLEQTRKRTTDLEGRLAVAEASIKQKEANVAALTKKLENAERELVQCEECTLERDRLQLLLERQTRELKHVSKTAQRLQLRCERLEALIALRGDWKESETALSYRGLKQGDLGVRSARQRDSVVREVDGSALGSQLAARGGSQLTLDLRHTRNGLALGRSSEQPVVHVLSGGQETSPALPAPGVGASAKGGMVDRWARWMHEDARVSAPAVASSPRRKSIKARRERSLMERGETAIHVAPDQRILQDADSVASSSSLTTLSADSAEQLRRKASLDESRGHGVSKGDSSESLLRRQRKQLRRYFRRAYDRSRSHEHASLCQRAWFLATYYVYLLYSFICYLICCCLQCPTRGSYDCSTPLNVRSESGEHLTYSLMTDDEAEERKPREAE